MKQSYEDHIEQLKQKEQGQRPSTLYPSPKKKNPSSRPVYNWPLIGVLGLIGLGLLANAAALTLQVWAKRPLWSLEDSLMAITVILMLLLMVVTVYGYGRNMRV